MSKAKTATEREILKSICEYLTLRGIFHWRVNTGASVLMHKGRQRYVKFGFPGVSDIVGICPGGRFLAVEVKAENGRPTADQQAFLEVVRSNGGVAVVARSIEDIEKALHG